MKYIPILLLFVITSSNLSYSQFRIETNFNSVHIGRNQSLLISYKIKKLQIGLGVKYNFNKLVNFPQNNIYKKTFYAITDSEHWGMELNLKYQIFNKKDVFFIHLFLNSQYTKSHIRHEAYLAIGQLVPNPTSELDYVYIKHINYIGPIIALENNFGLAFDFYLSEKIYLTQKFGVGMVFFKNLDKNTIIAGDGDWELSEMLSFGVGYQFNKKRK